MARVAVVGVPTSAGAHAPGQERAPAAFRDAGMVELLERRGFEVRDCGDLPLVRWTPDQVSPRAQHADLVAQVASRVADVTAAIGPDEVLVVMGGDCTIEVGVVAGFTRRSERVGLIYLDAGPDLNVPSSVRLGFLDWMVSAHLLGLPEATDALSHVGPRFPLLDDDQIVFVGAVPDELTEWEEHVLADRALEVQWVDEVKAGPREAARAVLAQIADRVDRLLVHFDLDVVDFIDFPAADFPTINAGLTLAEALDYVREFAAHPKFAALTICEFNPDHVDEDHQLVRSFVEGVVAALPSPTDR